MEHRVFAAEACDTEREMLHDHARRLSMDEVAVRECILEHGDDRIHVVSRLWADVFEDEGEGLQTARPYVEFRCSVLVENSRDTCES